MNLNWESVVSIVSGYSFKFLDLALKDSSLVLLDTQAQRKI